MRLVSHPNVVQLTCFFYSKGDKVGGERARKGQGAQVPNTS